nr:hypothetical protein [Tanacetum cinerariifolium]
MVSNVNVLRPAVLDIIAAESNGTAIVTIQGNLIEDKVVVSSAWAVSAMTVSFGYQRPQLMVLLRYQKTRLRVSMCFLLKNRTISAQDWKSIAKPDQRALFSKKSNNEASKVKDSKFKDNLTNDQKYKSRKKEN